MRILGGLGLGVVLLAAALAPVLTPHDPGVRFADRSLAPPMSVHVIDDNGGWHLPFVHPVRLVNRLERRYEEDRTSRVALAWFDRGAVVRAGNEDSGPWLPLGGDSLGRDLWARLLYGARSSLLVAMAAVLGALLIGGLVGGVAGLSGGWVDELLMRLSDFVLVLPAMYVVLALRASLPIVLPATAVFALIAGVLAAVGWPMVARGVRAIVAVERSREYAHAAVAAGAGRWRLLVRHLLPAAWGFLATQATLLLSAFILAEATLSYVGMGFPDPMPSWGTMLQESASASTLVGAPWTLCPAAAIFITVLSVNLLVQAPRSTIAGRSDVHRGQPESSRDGASLPI